MLVTCNFTCDYFLCTDTLQVPCKVALLRLPQPPPSRLGAREGMGHDACDGRGDVVELQTARSGEDIPFRRANVTLNVNEKKVGFPSRPVRVAITIKCVIHHPPAATYAMGTHPNAYPPTTAHSQAQYPSSSPSLPPSLPPSTILQSTLATSHFESLPSLDPIPTTNPSCLPHLLPSCALILLLFLLSSSSPLFLLNHLLILLFVPTPSFPTIPPHEHSPGTTPPSLAAASAAALESPCTAPSAPLPPSRPP